MSEALNASLVLRRGARARVGLERAALIEAIGELGSISAAARRLGLSYKGAWDVVQALNNLFDTPVIVAAPGGKAGGAATVTPRGAAVVVAFRRVQAEIDLTLARLESGLSAPAADPFWSLGVRTSARNALRGRVSRITPGAVSGQVTLSLTDGARIVAQLTRRSIEDLDLTIGAPAIALIKAGLIDLARPQAAPAAADNRIAGVVTAREDGATTSEIRLDIGGGKTLTASLTRERADALAVAAGDPLIALIDASHVLLAVE